MAAYSRDGQAAGMPRVANFKVHKVLGKGSYGKVYKVQRNSDDQFYALKETDLGALSQLERMDAVNEVRLLVSINHPNVIRYHEAFLNGSKLCVVMEYAPFGDLRYYISKGQRLKAPFPEEAIWRIFLQLAKGLQALHSNQIIHRDIKPANIFLCANDLLKIGDLGIAKALTHMQFARTQIGTPCYMAPEVWSGRPYSYGSDMWSLGCVLYEMMTFRTPMEGRTMQELKLRICSGRFAPISPGRYSPELTTFCHSLLSLDPKKRPTTEQILGSSAAAKWMHVLPVPPPVKRYSESPGAGAPGGAANARLAAALMDTIMVPRDLRQLPKVLPPPSYDSDVVAPLKPAPAMASAAAAAVVPGPRPPSQPHPLQPSSAGNVRPPLPSHIRAHSAGKVRSDAAPLYPPHHHHHPSAMQQAAAAAGAMLPPVLALKPAPGGLQLPPIGLQRQNSAGALQAPAVRPGVRRISYS